MKKNIVFFLVILFVLTFAISFSANEYNYEKYVSLGDSIAEGYDLEGYDIEYDYVTNKRFQAPVGSFPKNVANAVLCNVIEPPTEDFNFLPLALSGSKIIDMLYLLDDTGYYDSIINQYAVGIDSFDKKISSVKNNSDLDIINNISTADIITIEIGSNDLAVYPLYQSNIYQSLLSDSDITEEMILDYIKYMYEGYNNILEQYPQLLKRIRQLNPKAELVVVGLYNPFQNMKIHDCGLKIGYVANSLFEAVNIFYKSIVEKYDAIYVDITGTSYYFPTFSLITDDEELLKQNYLYKIHPNEAGAKYISDQILKAIPKSSGRNYTETPEQGDCTIYINEQNIGNYALTKVGNTWYIQNKTNAKFVVYDSLLNTVKESYIASSWYFENGAFCNYKTSITRKKFILTTTKTVYFLSINSDGKFMVSENAQKTVFSK